MDTGLGGKVALVVGASGGIGRAIARGLAREGARVAMAARRIDVLEEAARSIRADTGSEVLPLACDLTDREAVRRCVRDTATGLDDVEVLVTNAGGPRPGGFLDVSADDYEASFRLNFLSAAWLCQEAVPRMIETGRGGRIVMVASLSVKQPIDGLILSNSIRAGVAGLAKSMSNELGRHGIRVNVICPGFTATERLAELAAEVARRRGVDADTVRTEWAAGTPLGRIGEPDEIADLAVYLASDRASFITGTVIAVDGGRTKGLL